MQPFQTDGRLRQACPAVEATADLIRIVTSRSLWQLLQMLSSTVREITVYFNSLSVPLRITAHATPTRVL